jgi:hypothetical protein
MQAQETKDCKISLSSISLSTGWYHPSMDYWNNTFLPNANTSDRFNGNMYYSGHITVDFPLNLGMRAGAWYWQEKVSGQNGLAFNSLNVNFTGLSIGAYYKYKQDLPFKILPYIGIDGNYLMVQDKYDVSGTSTKKSGNDLVCAPFIGIEHVFFQKMIIGVEYSIVLGRYLQEVVTAQGISSPKISVNGSKIGIIVGYKL